MPRALRIVLLTVLLWPLPASVAGEEPPVDDDALARSMPALRQITDKLREHRWRQVSVETFVQAPKELPWAARMGEVKVKEGELIVRADGAGGGFCWAQRPAPQAMRRAPGYRIELELSFEAAGGIQNLGLLIGEKDAQIQQWDLYYEFAAGGNGSIQRCRLGFTQVAVGVLGNLPQNQPVRVRLEVIDRQLTGRRDKNDPLSMRLDAPPAIGADSVIGVTGLCKELRLKRVAVSTLEPTTRPEQLTDLWKRTAFAGPDELTAWLLDHAVGPLGSDAYRDRQAAADLWLALVPLSQPAAAKALGDDRLSEDARAVLTSVRDAIVPPILLVSPTSQPDAAPADTPATTQPHG